MRVLILIDNLVPGGMQRRLLELIRGLREQADIHIMLVVFSDQIHFSEVFDIGVPVVVMKRKPKYNPLILFKVIRICQRWRPDLLHCWGMMSVLLAIPSKLLFRLKLINGSIVNAPGAMSLFDKRLLRAKLTYPFSSVIVGNSKAGLRDYRVPPGKAICIHNGFNAERLKRLKEENVERQNWGITGRNVVGMVGVFTKKKDFATFIGAALKVLGEIEDITFVCVGDGPELNHCRELVPPSKSDRFVFTGRIKDVESVIKIFDIGVLMTNHKIHGEGISNAILEYMALGKAVISSYGGGTDEIVVHGETGFLVAPGSEGELQTRILELLRDADLRRHFGSNGKKRISSEFNLERMTEAYLTLYKRTCLSKF